MSEMTSVTFAGTVASGSITLTYLFYSNNGQTIQRKIVRATFTAARVAQ